MVPARRRLPTSAWAELPAADSAGGATFQPFVADLSSGRVLTPLGTAAFGSGSETPSTLIDEDTREPQLGLF